MEFPIVILIFSLQIEVHISGLLLVKGTNRYNVVLRIVFIWQLILWKMEKGKDILWVYIGY